MRSNGSFSLCKMRLTSIQLKMSSLSVLGGLFLPAESIERSCEEISSGVDEAEEEEGAAAPAGGAAAAAVAAAAEGPFVLDVRVNSSF